MLHDTCKNLRHLCVILCKNMGGAFDNYFRFCVRVVMSDVTNTR